MKTCILTNEYHTEKFRAGGIARRLGKTANWLAEQGHEVIVCILSDEDDLFEERENLWVHRFKTKPQLRWNLRQWAHKNHPEKLSVYEESRTAAQVVGALMEEHKFDVIFTSNSHLCFHLSCDLPVPMVHAISSYWPILAEINFDPPFLEKSFGWLMDWMTRHGIQQSSYVYAPSNLLANMMGELLDREIDVIRTPVYMLEEASTWDRLKEKYTLPDRFFLYWGTLQGVKGVHTLAAALKLIFPHHEDLHLVLAGRDRNGPDDSKSMATFISNELNDFAERLHILPPLDHPELFALIQQAACVAAPSLMDNFPNAVLEAMYFEKIIVGTTGASIDEMLDDGISGLLVERGSVQSLADGLTKALDMEPSEKLRMGNNAKERALTLCNPETVMNQLFDRLKEASQKQSHKTCSLRKGDLKFLAAFLKSNGFGSYRKDIEHFNRVTEKYVAKDEVRERYTN